MATLANFRSRIQAELGIDTANSGTDQTEADARVNEGVADFMERTHIKVTTGTMDLTSGTDNYTLDTDILAIDNVLNSENRELEQVEDEELFRLRAGNSSTTSPAMRYAVKGSNLFMVYPTPSSSETLTTYYVPRPAALSASAATPSEIPTEFHPAVEAYALWKLASMRDDQTSGQGQRYREQYEDYVRRARRAITLKGGRRLPRARVGRRRSVPHDPSADVRW